VSLPSILDGLTAMRRALLADAQGGVVEARPDDGWRPDQEAASASVAAVELAAVGSALGLSGLDLILVKGREHSTAVAPRAGQLLLVEVAAGQRTAEVEQALLAWEHAGALVAPGQAPAAPPAQPAGHATGAGATAVAEPTPAAETTPAAKVTPAAKAAPAAEVWSALRRSLARGALTEAVMHLRAMPEASLEAIPGLAEAAQLVLEGAGSVLAHDSAAGLRTLRPVSEPTQPNVSLRWLANLWCARAALASGSIEAARRHVKDALELSRQLDLEARAASQVVAAELLLRAGEHDKALAWVGESRSRFERCGDPWGQARAWLVEARIRAAAGATEACIAAAHRASELEPGWDGPPIFLAERAFAAGDLDGAEAHLAPVTTRAVVRLRRLVAAVRQGVIDQASATEFLRLHLGPPTATALRTVERIADEHPAFPQAREALAWMLFKLGRYHSALGLFTWLAAQPLGPEELASVEFGRRSAEAALQAGGESASGAGPSPAAPPRVADAAPEQRAASNGPASAAFSGRLSVFSFTDLLEFLRSARRSGLLVCSSEAGVATLRFHLGFITRASAPGVAGVGELLQRAGRLGPEALAALPADPGEAEVVLLRDGLAGPVELEAALRAQIDHSVRALVGWSDGEFAFNKEPEKSEAAAPAVQVAVDAQELLLTLFTEQDEATRAPAASGAGG